jgi:hypothetical protein
MLAMSISFPQRHAGNSVHPGTNKRSKTDMGYDLTWQTCLILLQRTQRQKRPNINRADAIARMQEDVDGAIAAAIKAGPTSGPRRTH